MSAAFRCASYMQSAGQPDRDGLGRPVARGTACATCPECDVPHGDVGIAGADLRGRLEVEGGRLQIVWQCPECNRTMHEDTDWLSVIEDEKKVKADPLCVFCRQVAA